MTIERIQKYEARARELFAAGFTTKSSQKDAREAASRAYSDVRRAILDACLAEDRGAKSDAVYWGMPDYPHLWKAKHAQLVRDNMPAAAGWIEHADRLAILTAEIKAAPVVPKPPKKLNDGGLPITLSDAFNPELKAQFLAQAPEIKASYIADVRRAGARMVETFGPRVPASISDEQIKALKLSKFFVADHDLFRHHCNVVQPLISGARWLELDEARLEEQAERYSILVALQWFYKVNGKLGQLAEATLHRDQGGYVLVSGVKADGSKVNMRQQRVMKWAPVAGGYFNQFPSHLYVDGKFHTALEYVDRFADATAEE